MAQIRWDPVSLVGSVRLTLGPVEDQDPTRGVGPEATVPAGSTITDVTVTDSCSNTTG